MRLSGFDEYPYHQHPMPFGTVATTDAHYNDGYWFAFYAPGWYVNCGLRLHPNVNVMDGWASVAHAERQIAVRASRALRPRYDELAVGPIKLELLEPMKRLRLSARENPAGIEFDIVMEALSPPFVENRYQHLKYGAVVNDMIRYTQICRAEGRARIEGRDIAIDGWHAMRDHSWGVRSSMAMPTGINGTDRTADEADDRALRLWVPFRVADHSGFINTHENAEGTALDFEGRLDYDDGRAVKILAARHALDYLPGTKRPTGGTLELDGEDGVTRKYTLASAGTPADVQACGYYRGWHDGQSAGIWRGAEHLEHDAYDAKPGDDPTGPPHVAAKRRLGPTEFPMIMTGPGGAQGMAHFEHTLSGAYPRYGFGT